MPHTKILSISSLLVAWSLFFAPIARAADAADPGPIKIENFSPQGPVTTIRQVRVQFSAAAAPFGDLNGAPDPLVPLCSGDSVPAGAGRWVDQSNWVYEFQSDLPDGVKCGFTVTSAFRESHPKFTGTDDFKFTTTPAKPSERPDPCKPGGPLLTLQSPSGLGEEEDDESYDGYGRPADIAENQTFVLETNCPLDSKSISKGVWFEAEGIKDRIGVQLIDGAEREKLIAERGVAGRENLIAVKPKLNFPVGTKVSLVFGKGARSASGFARSEEQRIIYTVRPQFEVSTRCAHTYSDGSCDPYLPIFVVFTSSIPEWAEGEYQYPGPVKLQAADGRIWQGSRSAFRENDRDFAAVQFTAPFPAKQELTLVVPEKLQDQTGRKLQNTARFPIKVKVGKIPPMVRFGAVFGIVESKSGSGLPVTIRSIDSEISVNAGSNVDLINNVGDLNATVSSTSNPADVLKWMIAVQNRYENIEANESSVFATSGLPSAVDNFTVKKPNGAEPFEVVGIPFKKPGFYVVEIASPSMGSDLRGPGKTLYVPTSVLVTDMAVHFKLGRESSLAWVTSLDTGEVVAGADVSVRDCKGNELARGVTDKDGIARIGALPANWQNLSCGFDQKYGSAPGVKNVPVYDNSLVISAKKGDDFTFVLSNWTEGIENWRFGMPQEYYGYGPNVLRTVFDRTLFKRNETVHMKHVLRTKSTRGFDLVKAEDRPVSAEIRHLGGGDTYDLSLTWKENGTAENEWKIPADAKLGEYNVYFKRPDGSFDYRYTGAFSVLEYRVPLMRAVIVPPKDEVIVPPQVPIDVSVHYLAGGGASNLPVKVRYQVQPASYSFSGKFEDFSFASEIPVTSTPSYEYSGEYEGEEGAVATPAPRNDEIRTVSATLDGAGSARIILEGVPQVTRPSKLFTELEFKDPNGEIQTVSSTVPLLPNPYLVGIKTDSWALSKSKFKFSVAVVSSRGEPIAGVPVGVNLFQRDVYTHRKRVIGGTFIYENVSEDSDKGAICNGTTGQDGTVLCTVDMQLSGNFIVEARAKDPSGRLSSTASSIFVGEDDFWFAQENTDRMDLLPEKKEYEPGETARFQARVPFKRSTALVTVEREGVIDAFVTPLNRNSPVIELPVKGNYGPNVFVSAMAVRGRIGEATATALFDPGKPAFRLGLAQIRVGWKDYTLKVGMKTDREVYKVREKVPVTISVRTADGGIPPAGTEVSVAAVDEGLLELKPNASWKLLEEMMEQRALGVQTLTAQMFVIGKRHFGLKALPFGGGGGKGSTRELFDTLLYWNPAVQLDASGNASITVPLNDSITSFKIVGVGIGKTGTFGTGSATVRSTKDFILFAGMPPLVRNGDTFTAEVTARNTTAVASEVTVDLQMSGDGSEHPPAQKVTVGAGESKIVSWPIHAPKDGESLTYTASVSKDGAVEDSLKVSQALRPPVQVQVQQATLSQLKSPQKIPIELPKNAVEGRGGIRVTFASNLGEDLEALRDYMRKYPFSCLEQRTSKAVSLRDAHAWSAIASDLPTYIDNDGFAKYFPGTERGSEVLSSYVLAIAHEAGFEIPDSPKARLIQGLKNFVAGKVRTNQFRYLDQFYSDIGYKSKLLSYAEIDLLGRKIAALEALSRYGEADLALVSGLWPDPNLVPTSAVVNLLSIAARSPKLSDRARRLKELEQVLRSRLDLAGTTMRFSGENNEGFFWSMVSSDVTAIQFVSTVLSNDDLFKKFSQDMGRLVRGMLDRQDHGKWDLTVANAWGALAIERQKERLSPIPIAGTSSAGLGAAKFEFPWPEGDLAGKVQGVSLLPWPSAKSNLDLAHQGTGAPWVTVQSLAAVPRTAPVSAGYTLSKKIEPISQKVPGEYHVGDVLRVTVPFNAQSAKTWVVVNDPVPGGVTILGSGLDRDSALLTQEKTNDFSWVTPAFEERSFEAFRAYFQELPKGDFSVQYVMRFNTPGEYQLPATRIEAMYAPEMFGELPNAKVTVLP